MAVEEILWSTSKNSVEEYAFIDKDTVTFECSDNSSFYNVSNNHGTIVASNIDTNVIEIVSNNKNVLKLRAKANDTLYDKDGGYFTWYIHNVDSKEYGSQGYSLKVKLIAKPNITREFIITGLEIDNNRLCADRTATIQFEYWIDGAKQLSIPTVECKLINTTLSFTSTVQATSNQTGTFTATVTVPKNAIIPVDGYSFWAKVYIKDGTDSTCKDESYFVSIYGANYTFKGIKVTK